MAKISSERRGKGPAALKSLEETIAEERIKPTMPLDQIVSILAENHISTWHMRCNGSHVMVFRGDDAPSIMGQIYEFLYGKA